MDLCHSDAGANAGCRGPSIADLAQSQVCLEIWLVRPRDNAVFYAVIYMRVVGTDLFRHYGKAAPIGHGRRPGRRENAVILDRELKLVSRSTSLLNSSLIPPNRDIFL